MDLYLDSVQFCGISVFPPHCIVDLWGFLYSFVGFPYSGVIFWGSYSGGIVSGVCFQCVPNCGVRFGGLFLGSRFGGLFSRPEFWGSSASRMSYLLRSRIGGPNWGVQFRGLFWGLYLGVCFWGSVLGVCIWGPYFGVCIWGSVFGVPNSICGICVVL